MKYLQDIQNLPLILEDKGTGTVKWHIDGSFAVHNNMKSYSKIYMTTGKGATYLASIKQISVAKSLTEDEHTAINIGINLILWTKYFLEDQGVT